MLGFSTSDEGESTPLHSRLASWMSNQSSPMIATNGIGEIMGATAAVVDVFGRRVSGGTSRMSVSSLVRSVCEFPGHEAVADRIASWLPVATNQQSQPAVLAMAGGKSWSVMLVPQFTDDMTPPLWLWMFQDASESLRLEQRPSQSEKIKVISRFAGGAVHEFNNLLTVILGNLDLMRCVPNLEVNALLSRIDATEASALRANHLIKELRLFATHDEMMQEYQSVVPVANKLCDRLNTMTGDQISVNCTYLHEDAGQFKTRINAEQLEVALLKLGQNAIEAIGVNVGSIVVQLRIIVISGVELLQVSIEDSGTGIKPSLWETAFEPFFTTKDRTTSAGLGMATANALIQEMNGVVQIVRSNSEGTEIGVWFPVETGPASQEIDKSAGVLSVALVEEKRPARNLGQSMLRLLGHRPVAFASVTEIISELRDGREFDVVLLTNTMHEDAADETYTPLRSINQSVRVIEITGKSQETDLSSCHSASRADARLTTPYSLSELSEALTKSRLT